MKILKERITKSKRRVTIELEDTEGLVSVQKHAYYKLGYPHKDIVRADQLMGSHQVT